MVQIINKSNVECLFNARCKLLIINRNTLYTIKLGEKCVTVSKLKRDSMYRGTLRRIRISRWAKIPILQGDWQISLNLEKRLII